MIFSSLSLKQNQAHAFRQPQACQQINPAYTAVPRTTTTDVSGGILRGEHDSIGTGTPTLDLGAGKACEPIAAVNILPSACRKMSP